MKKILIIMVLCILIVNAVGCGFESEELKRIKSISTSYAYTSEDSKILKEKKNDKEVQRWLEDVAEKIQKREYSSTEISALVSFLKSADVEHPDVEEQVRLYYADVMKDARDKAFAASSTDAIIDYAEEVKKMGKKVSAEEVESYLPYDELAKYIQDNFTLTISKDGVGGYYDDAADNYKNNYEMVEGSASKLTLKQSRYHYFDFSGDYMLRGFKKEIYRETGEAWEEEILEPLDYESITVYYKDVEVHLGEKAFSELSKSDVYVEQEGESYIVFMIQGNKISAYGDNKGFTIEYKSK